MANRWCIATIKAPDGENPGYRNAITDHTGVQFNFGSVPAGSPPDPPFTVAQVANADVPELTGDPDIFILPDSGIGTTLNTWGAADRLALTACLNALGVTRDLVSSDTLRDVLNDLGQRVSPTFDAANYDTESIPV